MLALLKQAVWRLLGEYLEWRDLVVRHIPGQLGIAIRRRYFRKILGSCGIGLRAIFNVRVLNPSGLKLGDHVELAWDVFIEAGGGVRMGNYVAIGPGTKIWSNNHRFEDPDRLIRHQGLENLEVVIGDDVWIGADCIIKPGVTIGRGAVVSAGTILSKSIPEFAIAAGNPGRVVAWRKPPDQGVKQAAPGAEVAPA